ncbi:MAG: tyrosine-type recombinase/integrase [Solibacillus sp.]
MTLCVRVNKEIGLDVKLHTFRHMFATILISEGIDAVTVAKISGNIATMVYKVYAHTLENQMAKATNIIEQSMGTL